jgi:hypothetical protein
MQVRPLLLLALTFFTASVMAHHGNASHFDAEKPVSLDAIIKKVEFVNPHSYVYFDVIDNNGAGTPWRCEMAAATTLRRSGWEKEILSEGQNIIINGSLARREANVCVVTSMVFDDGFEVSRRTDVSAYKKVTDTPTAEEGPSEEERIAKAMLAQPDFSGRWVTIGAGFSRPRGGAGRVAGAQRGDRNANANVSATEAGLAAAEGYDGNFDNPNLKCQASDIIMAIQRDSHVNEFIDTGDRIAMNFGYMSVERTIHMNVDAHPDNIESSLEGHSIGKWEESALLIDTVGFLPSTYGGNGNYMTSDQLHITERFEFDAAESQLKRSYTLDDSLYINGTITGNQTLLMTDDLYEEYGCKELSGSNNQRP